MYSFFHNFGLPYTVTGLRIGKDIRSSFRSLYLTDEETKALRIQGKEKLWEDSGGSGVVLNLPKFCHKNRKQL